MEDSKKISDESIHIIKWITNKNQDISIITQNKNGPCPLLAIMNILLLQKYISLPPSTSEVTSDYLISLLGDYLVHHISENKCVDENIEQKMHDALQILPSLQSGLNINCGFRSVTHFEYTPSLEVFDLLDIPLLHAWVVDPEASEITSVVKEMTYNQLMDLMIKFNNSENKNEKLQVGVIKAFMSDSSWQMTEWGLEQLRIHLTEDRWALLFRNNHFLTLHKFKDRLFVLVTDQGYLKEPAIVWESLDNIHGNSTFCDINFDEFCPGKKATDFLSIEDQINHDFLVALSLEEHEPLATISSNEDIAPQKEENKLDNHPKESKKIEDPESGQEPFNEDHGSLSKSTSSIKETHDIKKKNSLCVVS